MAELYSKILDHYYQDLGMLEADLSKDVAMHENIRDDARKLSSIYSKWRCLKAIAESRYRQQKRLVKETIWPSACLAADKRATDSGMKASQYKIEWSAMQDPAYAAAAEIQNRYGLVLDMLKGVVDTLWLKKDMIQSEGYGDGRELRSTPKLQEQTEVQAPWGDTTLPVRDKELSMEELEAKAKDTIRRSKQSQNS